CALTREPGCSALDRLRRPGHTLQQVLGCQRSHRRRGDAADAYPGLAHHGALELEGEGDRHAGDVVEAALGDLLELRYWLERPWYSDLSDELGGSPGRG